MQTNDSLIEYDQCTTPSGIAGHITLALPHFPTFQSENILMDNSGKIIKTRFEPRL